MCSFTKPTTETVAGSRRRHWQRFAASVAWWSRLLRQRRGVVDQDGAVGSAGGEAVAVGAEGDAVISEAVSGEGEKFLTGFAIPNLDRRVV